MSLFYPFPGPPIPKTLSLSFRKAFSILGFFSCGLLVRGMLKYRKIMGRPLQRLFDLDRIHIVLVDEGDLVAAENLIVGCEYCSQGAHLPLDYLLDALTASDPVTTEYLLPRPAQCPRCRSELTEKTAVRLD